VIGIAARGPRPFFFRGTRNGAADVLCQADGKSAAESGMSRRFEHASRGLSCENCRIGIFNRGAGMTDIGTFTRDDLKSIPTFRSAYSDRTALLMAKLAYRAYEMFDSDDDAWTAFSNAICSDGFTDCKGLIDRDIGTSGFVAQGDDMLVVVFRGTENSLDWWTNLNTSFVTLQGGTRVHTGFFQAYWPIRDTIFECVIDALRKKRRPVYITGHSLGGALALMATAELSNHEDAEVRDCVAACYTFGCPRAGDSSFDLYVKAPLYRITNGVDLVPAVPPAIFGYRHVGDTRYFGKLGISPSRRAPFILQKFWQTIWGIPQFLLTFKLLNIADHNMTAYLAKLSAWADKNIDETQTRRLETADPKVNAMRL
jgi:triacylglycerol lipase